jgi:parallel beta-helix repeat protein
MKSGMKLYGGYAGDGAPNPDAREIAAYTTMLSGDIGMVGVAADNSYHVVTAIGVGADTVMDGLTLSFGSAAGLSEQFGGGLYATGGSSLQITNCTFSQNQAISGGGIYNYFSSPNLTNCVFKNNAASYTGDGSYGGGGMYNVRSAPRLTNCTLTENTAISLGGGMYNYDGSSPILINTTFSGNTATDSGGGMYNYSSSPSLMSCSFIANSASDDGGGMSNEVYSAPTLTNCSFSGNKAYGGGGIYNYAGGASPLSLTNCTFSGNTAEDSGGGIYSVSASQTLTGCTFSGNTASLGGGLYNDYNTGYSVILTNCIVWGSGNNLIHDSSSTQVITYCDIHGGYSGGSGNFNADPEFVRSPWTGPDGRFGTADDDYGDLRLRISSPCLDAGSNAAVPGSVTTDLAGSPRIQNGIVDVGAYEGRFAAQAPKVIYVDRSSVGANTGTSWSDAYTSLQSAILAAGEGDTIRIADGIYKPTTSTDRSISFAMKSGVSLYGGYAGFGAPNPDGRDIVAHATVLSGDIGKLRNNVDNSYHVVAATGIEVAALVDGFTVTFGNANGSSSMVQAYGGGFFASGSSMVTLNNCAFTGNAALWGGGMYNSDSSLVVNNCTFNGNRATYGGGLLCSNASPTLTNTTFNGNTASKAGGGMYSDSFSPILVNCTFSRNTAVDGGGMHSDGSSLNLTGCSFIGNTATDEGGGMYLVPSVSSPVTIVTNCTFSGNAATQGGGVFNFSNLIVTNCSFAGNAASAAGAALYNHGLPLILTNSIAWGSSSPISSAYSTPLLTYCDIQGGYTGSGNVNADPLFVRDPSPGGDGIWGTGDDDYGDLRLQAASPCIDAGDNSAVPADVVTDLAGNPRIVDLPGVRDFGERVDMGAYEVQSPGTYLFDAVKPSLRMSFPFDVNPSTLTSSDLVLTTAAMGSLVSFTATVSYDAATRSATWQFQTPLPDGDYRATISAGSVSDTLGNLLSSNILCNFFVLGGDANRDRKVDINDLAILAMNWQSSGRIFSQGDFNYDGKVDAADLGILSSHWQQALPPPPASAPASIVRAPTRTATRMVSVVG